MKKAFTLAEVLICLGIIGVVAALTIPSVVTNYKYKVYGAQLEKVYSQITEAARSIMNDEMSDSFSTTSAGVRQDNTTESCKTGGCYFLRNYFKVAKHNCLSADATTNTESCVADEYYYYNKTSGQSGSAGVFAGDFCAQTVSGAAICTVLNNSNGRFTVFLDVNGRDEPNMVGLDAFIMDILSDGTVKDWQEDATLCATKVNSWGHIGDYAQGCLSKAMQNNWKITD
ncbi:MAG: type II secretion system protein [Cyanobacteria bacterium SIG26]|nr:type II secretion system protein [Cyanobacteria bacterium SIG26]